MSTYCLPDMPQYLLFTKMSAPEPRTVSEELMAQ